MLLFPFAREVSPAALKGPLTLSSSTQVLPWVRKVPEEKRLCSVSSLPPALHLGGMRGGVCGDPAGGNTGQLIHTMLFPVTCGMERVVPLLVAPCSALCLEISLSHQAGDPPLLLSVCSRKVAT